MLPNVAPALSSPAFNLCPALSRVQVMRSIVGNWAFSCYLYFSLSRVTERSPPQSFKCLVLLNTLLSRGCHAAVTRLVARLCHAALSCFVTRLSRGHCHAAVTRPLSRGCHAAVTPLSRGCHAPPCHVTQWPWASTVQSQHPPRHILDRRTLNSAFSLQNGVA